MDQPRQTFRLSDGRGLGYAEYGDPAGVPVFFCHGAASSRLERPTNPEVLMAAGIHFISADRPGHGLSDHHSERSLLDWPDDVGQLADHLGLERFYVLGNSNGGPYALACAYSLPERVVVAGASSCVAPMGRSGAFRGLPLMNRVLAASARWFPPVAGFIRCAMRPLLMGDVEKAARMLMPSIPEADKEILHDPATLRLLASSVQEGYRQSWRGIALDDQLVNQDWGFDPMEIQVRVVIWHGTEDVNVPFHAGEYLHRTIPDSRLTRVVGAGHFFLAGRWAEVLASLVN